MARRDGSSGQRWALGPDGGGPGASEAAPGGRGVPDGAGPAGVPGAPDAAGQPEPPPGDLEVPGGSGQLRSSGGGPGAENGIESENENENENENETRIVQVRVGEHRRRPGPGSAGDVLRAVGGVLRQAPGPVAAVPATVRELLG
ncbi:hypothetical protein ACQ4WX_11060 [Streptomyces lasalocidi]